MAAERMRILPAALLLMKYSFLLFFGIVLEIYLKTKYLKVLIKNIKKAF